MMVEALHPEGLSPVHSPVPAETALTSALAACRATEREYKNGAVDARDGIVRALLTRFAQQRAQFATSLATLLAEYGGASAEHVGPRSVREVLLDGISELKSALQGTSDATVVASCCRSEEAAQLAYEHAMKGGPLPSDVVSALEAQHASLCESHAELVRLQRQKAAGV